MPETNSRLPTFPSNEVQRLKKKDTRPAFCQRIVLSSHHLSSKLHVASNDSDKRASSDHSTARRGLSAPASGANTTDLVPGRKMMDVGSLQLFENPPAVLREGKSGRVDAKE